MENYFSSDFKLGVLGGGQLGRMLLAETQKYDIYTVILDGAKNAPCAEICNEFHHGSLMDFQTVYDFGKKVDLLTIEIEHVNIEALKKLQAEGLSKLEAVRQAAQTRLRPILMISASTIAGHFPLTLVSGPGASARNSIGLVLVGGMAIGSLFTLFVIPSIYMLVARDHSNDREVDQKVRE